MMDTIKKILAKNKNACVVVVENEKPVFVITGFEEYDRMFSGNSASEPRQKSFFQDEKVLEEVNQEIINLGAPRNEMPSILEEIKEQDVQIIEDNPQMPQMPEMQEIKVEDIPL
jgi:CBS domain-containing protein